MPLYNTIRTRTTQREDHVETQEEGGHLLVKERTSGETNPTDILILVDLKPPAL